MADPSTSYRIGKAKISYPRIPTYNRDRTKQPVGVKNKFALKTDAPDKLDGGNSENRSALSFAERTPSGTKRVSKKSLTEIR